MTINDLGRVTQGGSGLPEGWVAVPCEPSAEMLHAPLPPKSSITSARYESRRDLRPLIYRAMLAAAPSPPVPDPGTAGLRDQATREREIWQRLSTIDLKDEIERYEFRAEEGDHTPTEDECAMLEDFANGLLGKVCELLAADPAAPVPAPTLTGEGE